MKYLYIILGIVLLVLINYSAYADKPHEHQEVTNVYKTNVYESTSITDSKMIAFSQAGANNHISAGTFKPQLSLGIGAYESDFAASLMFGQKACKDCLLYSGSFAFDGDFEEKAVGFGATITFK